MQVADMVADNPGQWLFHEVTAGTAVAAGRAP